MGFQQYICKYCNEGFGWCSVGTFQSWGKHKKNCKVLTSKHKLEWAVYQ